MKGNNLGSIQEMNRSLVLRLIKKQSVCSRVELAKQTGLQQATITNIINDFIQWRLVKETGMIEGSKGRRSIGLTMNDDAYFVAALRLTRKYFWVGIFTMIGDEVDTEKISLNSNEGPQLALDKMKQSVTILLERHKDKHILGLGVSLPGPYYPKQGKLDSITDFPGWETVSIKEELSNAFDIPVIIDHDANAGALAEWWIAPDSIDSGTIIYVAAGQGVGAGIIHNGRVFRGALGTAGEIGHTSIDIHGPACACGNRGCLTNYASTTAMLAHIREARDNYPGTVLPEKPTMNQMALAIAQKDPLATEAFKRTVGYLSVGLSNLICSYGPSEIIIGDEMAGIGMLLIDEIKRMLRICSIKKLTAQVGIKLSSFQLDPAFVGAAALAIDYALSNTAMIFTQVSESQEE